ncbi:MAG: sulfite exporter TauE/SafE family protein [Paracoccaceae bacterium]
MSGWEFWVFAVIAAVLTGIGKGGVPIVGALVVPVLSLVISPVGAAGLMLPVYVVSDWFGLYAYRREFDKRVLAITSVAMTIGVGLGWATAKLIPEAYVTVLVGVISVVFALNQLMRRVVQAAPKRAEIAPGLFWGTIAGFTSFVSHTGGPPYQVYTLPLGLKKAVFAGTSTIAFAYINALKLIPYYFLGQINLQSLETAAKLMPVAAAAVFFGVWVVRRMPERLFFQIVTWSLLLIGVELIRQGLVGAWA